jgi:hypothetical protein
MRAYEFNSILDILRPKLQKGSIDKDIIPTLQKYLDSFSHLITSTIYDDSEIKEFKRITINKNLFEEKKSGFLRYDY